MIDDWCWSVGLNFCTRSVPFSLKSVKPFSRDPKHIAMIAYIKCHPLVFEKARRGRRRGVTEEREGTRGGRH